MTKQELTAQLQTPEGYKNFRIDFNEDEQVYEPCKRVGKFAWESFFQSSTMKNSIKAGSYTYKPITHKSVLGSVNFLIKRNGWIVE